MAGWPSRRAPASSMIPIRPPSSRNASTSQRPCSGRPKRPCGSQARRGSANDPFSGNASLDRARSLRERRCAMTHVLVIDNYDSFTWNLVHLLGPLATSVEVVRNDAITTDEVLASPPDAIVL